MSDLGSSLYEVSVQQARLWALVLANLRDQVSEATPLGVGIRAALDTMRDVITRRYDSLSFFIEENGIGMVQSKLPLIDSPEILLQQDVLKMLGAVAVEVLPVVAESMFNAKEDASSLFTFADPLIANAAEDYRRERTMPTLEQAIQAAYASVDAVKNATGSASAAAREARQAAGSVRQEATDFIGRLATDRDRLNAAVASVDATIAKAVEELKADAALQIAAFLKAQGLLKDIEAPVELFGRLRRQYSIRYFGGLALLVVIVAAVGTAAVFSLPRLYDFLGFNTVFFFPQQAFTSKSTLTIAVVVGVMAAVGWVLKISGRVVTNSLTLAEDAEIRAALAHTFLGLVSKDAIRDEDRTIMLAALFRPLPGHQQEDIEPPTVLSIAKDAITAPRGGKT